MVLPEPPLPRKVSNLVAEEEVAPPSEEAAAATTRRGFEEREMGVPIRSGNEKDEVVPIDYDFLSYFSRIVQRLTTHMTHVFLFIFIYKN